MKADSEKQYENRLPRLRHSNRKVDFAVGSDAGFALYSQLQTLNS